MLLLLFRDHGGHNSRGTRDVPRLSRTRTSHPVPRRCRVVQPHRGKQGANLLHCSADSGRGQTWQARNRSIRRKYSKLHVASIFGRSHFVRDLRSLCPSPCGRGTVEKESTDATLHDHTGVFHFVHAFVLDVAKTIVAFPC